MSRILIVDDEDSVRELILSSLNQFTQHEVEIAHDGFEAVQKIMVKDYDLIITDVKMPKMNGIDVVKAVKIIKNDLPVIVITGYASESERQEALDVGAAEILLKPCSIKQLLEKIEFHLNLEASDEDIIELEEDDGNNAVLPEKVVLIGSSSGGPKTLIKLLLKLNQKEFPPIVITQHIPEGFSKSIVAILKEKTGLEVKLIEEDDILENNKVYVVKSPNHILLKNNMIVYEESDIAQKYFPSISNTFTSFSQLFKEKCLLVIFKGLAAHLDSKEGVIQGKLNGSHIYALEDNKSKILDKLKQENYVNDIVDINKLADKILSF